MKFRSIERNELEKIRNMDRGEQVEQIYHYKNSKLILVDENYEIYGWDPDNLKNIISNLYRLYDRNGTFIGAFGNKNMVGIVALELNFIGKDNDTLQLDFLHVDRKYRKKGIGKSLLEMAAKRAKYLGAKKLYISATPSKNTIQFYLHNGCRLTEDLNKELYELEPDDIHLELDLCNF